MKFFIFYTLLLGVIRTQFCNGVKSCRSCSFYSTQLHQKPTSEEEECINGVLRKSKACGENTELAHLRENEITCRIRIVWRDYGHGFGSYASSINRWCEAENKSLPTCNDKNWQKYYTPREQPEESICTCNSDDCNTHSMLDYFFLAPKRKWQPLPMHPKPGVRKCQKCKYDSSSPLNHGKDPAPDSSEKRCIDSEKRISECRDNKYPRECPHVDKYPYPFRNISENDTFCKIEVFWRQNDGDGKLYAEQISRVCATKDDSIPNCNDENWLKYHYAVRYWQRYTYCNCNFDNCNEYSFGDYFGQNRKLITENIINTTPAPSTPRPQSHFSGNSKEVPFTALIISCTLIIHN